MSGPSKPSWVSQSDMDAIKAFNAGLTSAGNRSRPGRSRAPVAGGGGGSGFASGRASNFAVPLPRTGSGVRTGPGTSWAVGPTTAQPQFKPVSPRARSRSPTRAASTPTYTVGPLPGTTTPKPPSPPKIRNPVMVAGGPIVAEPRATPAAIVPEPAGHFQQQPPPQGRERITTNMTPDDSSKPWIPAHLQQKSAFGAIRHLSEITGLALDELTSDGVSIPAVPKNRSASVNVPVAVGTQANTSTAQGYVDPNAWMSAYANRGNTNGGIPTQVRSESTAPAPRVASYSEMDVDMADGSIVPTVASENIQQGPWKVGTLTDSRWASAPAAKPSPFAAAPTAFHFVPSTSGFQSQQTFGNTTQNVPALVGQSVFGGSSTENVKPNPPPSNPIDATSLNFAKILTEAIVESKGGKKMATLKDSRWA